MQRRCACSDKFWIRRRLLSKADRNLWSQTRRSHDWFPFQIIPTLLIIQYSSLTKDERWQPTFKCSLVSETLTYCKMLQKLWIYRGRKTENFKMFVPFQKGCICYLPTVKKISSQNTYRAVCQGIIDKGVYMEWRNRLKNLAFKLANLWQPHCARLAFFCNDLSLR